MKTCFLIVAATLLLSGNSLKGQTPSFDPEIRKFYLSLDTISGNRLLRQRHPAGGPESIRLTAYREFFHALVFQSKPNLDSYYLQSDQWLKKLEKLKPSSTSLLTSIAEIHLYRALLGSYCSEYKTAAVELYASYKILSKSGPAFEVTDRNKLSGIIGVLFQQVPDQYVKYIKALGIRPTGLSGFNGLERYYSAALPGTIERMEGFLLLVTAYKEFGKTQGTAWNFVKSEGKPMLENPLIRYQCALGALKAGDCAASIALLDSRFNGGIQSAFPYWTYQLGRCKLYQNDPSSTEYLEKFLKNPGGDNYRHQASLLLGWSYIIQNQPDKAKVVFGRVKSMSEPFTPFDKQALREATNDKLPDPDLLKVRLLFDGGYFEPCLEYCDKLVKSAKFRGPELGELMYRKARCEQRMGKTSQSISSFLAVIEKDEEIKSYIVPNAALQLGNLYKKAGQVELARKYYKLSLELNKYGFREGISRQAELALKELDN